MYAQGGPPAAVGTGPFKFKEWVPGDHVTIEQERRYWNADAGGPYLDEIIFKPIADPTATLNALQAGDIDISQTLAPIDIAAAKADTDLQFFDRGAPATRACWPMNQKLQAVRQPQDPPGHRLRGQPPGYHRRLLRRDRRRPENWMPPGTSSTRPPGLPTTTSRRPRPSSPRAASTDLTFDFWYPSDVSRPYMPDPKGLVEAIPRDLEAVGFKPNPKTAPWRPDYLAAEARGNYPVWLLGWTCDWPGTDNFLYTAFFGYRGDQLGPNPEFAYKNDAMNDAMVAAPGVLRRGHPAGRVDEGPGPHPRRHPVGAARLGQDRRQPGRPTSRASCPRPTLNELFTDVWLDK